MAVRRTRGFSGGCSAQQTTAPRGVAVASERASRLARAVRIRLAELGVSARALSRAGYVPRATIERTIAGASVPRSLVGLDRGLGWRPGSAACVADGGEPTPVLRLPGQPLGSAGEVHLSWPREDGDWRAACEEAWEAADDLAVPEQPGQPAGRGDAASEGWFEDETEDWPAWLADRTRRVLAEADTDQSAELVELADRIMGLDHVRDLLRLLDAWLSERRRGAGHKDAPS